jgi:hypothetical protein
MEPTYYLDRPGYFRRPCNGPIPRAGEFVCIDDTTHRVLFVRYDLTEGHPDASETERVVVTVSDAEEGAIVSEPTLDQLIHGEEILHLTTQNARLKSEVDRLRAALRPFAEMARPNEDETEQGHGETIAVRGYASDMTGITSGDVAAAGRAMWPEHGCDPDVWYPEDGS